MRIMPNGSSADWTQKIAMPVNITPQEHESLRGDGIAFTNDPELAEQDVMQGLKGKKKIRAIHNVCLPRIMYPNTKNIIELDGRQYYLIDIAEPQPKKNPEGTIYLLNLETGEPERRPFMQYADRLTAVKRNMVSQSVEGVNAKIRRWNDRVDQIRAVENPSTWPLQLAWAIEVIDGRLAELTGQEEAFVRNLDEATNFSPSLSAIIQRIKGDIQSGRITNEQDLLDNLIFVNYNEPDAIQSLITLPTVPESVRNYFSGLQNEEHTEMESEKAKEQHKTEERQDRVETPVDYGVIRPGTQPTFELNEQEISDRANKTRLPTPDQYFSPHGKTKQIRATLIGIRRDKAELTGVRNALDSLRDYIGHLAAGERGRSVLMGTERGKEIMQKITEFGHKAQAFMRRYSVEVFVDDPDTGQKVVNPKLFGTKGGKGNSEVAVVVNQMYSIIMSSVKAHASEPEPALQEVATDSAMMYLQEDSPDLPQ